MQSFRMPPCIDSELASSYFFEIYEEIIQMLVISEVARIDLLKDFSHDLVKCLRLILGLEAPNVHFKQIKKQLCDRFKLIAKLHGQIDAEIVTICINEIESNGALLLLELPEIYDRIEFMNQIENIYNRNFLQLSILSYMNTVFVPQEDVPIQTTENTKELIISLSDYQSVADIESHSLNLINKAIAYFKTSGGGRESLLKAIALYTGATQHIEGIKIISNNYLILSSVCNFNLSQAIKAYSYLIMENNIEEAVICNRRVLMQLLELEGSPATEKVSLELEIVAAKRNLLLSLLKYLISKEFTHRKMTRTLHEVIKLINEIPEKNESDIVNLRAARSLLVIKYAEYSLFAIDKLKEYSTALRAFEEAIMHNRKLYAESLVDDEHQRQFVTMITAIVSGLINHLPDHKRLAICLAYQEQHSLLLPNCTDESFELRVSIIHRNLAQIYYRKGLSLTIADSIDKAKVAKTQFELAIDNFKSIGAAFRIPQDNESQQYSHLYLGTTCVILVMLEKKFNSEACTDILFNAVEQIKLSCDINKNPKHPYYSLIRSFSSVLAQIADEIIDDSYFYQLKIVLQAIFITLNIERNQLKDCQAYLTKLQSQMLKAAYNFIFQSNDSYERSSSEIDLVVIFEAASEINKIDESTLSDLNKFYLASIKIELEKFKMVSMDYISFKIVPSKKLPNYTRFTSCFFKDAAFKDKESIVIGTIQDDELIITGSEDMRKFRNSNDIETLKKVMNTWLDLSSEPDEVENDVLEEINTIEKLDKLLNVVGPVERPRRYSI